MGRPSSFRPEVGAEVCRRMAAGETRNQICKDESMPHSGTIRAWIDSNPDFAAQYARAFDLLLEHYAEEIIDIGDDGTNDWMERDIRNNKGEVVGTLRVVDQENINRSRLRCDNRKWLLSKLARHRYGDKVDMTLDATVRPGTQAPVLATTDPVEAMRTYQQIIQGKKD